MSVDTFRADTPFAKIQRAVAGILEQGNGVTSVDVPAGMDLLDYRDKLTSNTACSDPRLSGLASGQLRPVRLR